MYIKTAIRRTEPVMAMATVIYVTVGNVLLWWLKPVLSGINGITKSYHNDNGNDIMHSFNNFSIN